MLLDAIPSSVLLIDRDLRIVSVNRNFLEKNRRTLPDTIGHRLEEVFPAIIIDQMDFPGRIRQVFEKNFRIKGERMTYRAPGIPLRIYYYSILPFSWQGVVELAMLLMDDVTEQVRLSEEVHRVERHLASVVESAQDIVLSTDMEGQILTWNTAAEKLSGFTLYAVRGQNFFDFCAGDDQGEMERIFANLQAGEEAQMAEWDLKTRDGGRIPVSWIFSPMKDHLGQTAGIVAVGRDLTERRKFEAQLLQSQKLAALGVMAGGIAHEIRNPLAVCGSAAQFIMEEQVTPEFRQECAQKIHTGIQRASMIIENLLRFARPSVKPDIKEIDLTRLIEETLSLVTNQARIQKIELRTQQPGGDHLDQRHGSLVAAGLHEPVAQRHQGHARWGRLGCRPGTGQRGSLGQHQRHRPGDCPRGPEQHLRPLLHHRARGPGHGIGPVHLLFHHQAALRHHHRGQ